MVISISHSMFPSDHEYEVGFLISYMNFEIYANYDYGHFRSTFLGHFWGISENMCYVLIYLILLLRTKDVPHMLERLV